MPEVREYFPEIEALDMSGLHLRKSAILGPYTPTDGTPIDYKKLSDDTLAELLAISRAMRKKAAVSGTRTAKPKAPKGETSLLDLA